MESNAAGWTHVEPLRAVVAAAGEIGRVEDDAWTTVSRVRATVERAAEKLGDREFGRTCQTLFTAMFNGAGNIWADLVEVRRVIERRCDDCQRAMAVPDLMRDETAELRELYPAVLEQVEKIREVLESEPDDPVLAATAVRVRGSLPAYPSTGLSPWEDMTELVGKIGKSLSPMSDCRAGLLAVLDHLAGIDRMRPLVVEQAERAADLINDPRVPPEARTAAQPALAAIVAYVRDGSNENLRAQVRELNETLGGSSVVSDDRKENA